MSEVTKALERLQRRKAIQVFGYRRSKRTGLDVPVYSVNAGRGKRLDVHPLLAGVTSERLVEYDFAARNLLPRNKKSKILDIGSSGSGLTIAIRQFGGSRWQVSGIDLASDGCDIRTDARSTCIRSGTIDQVICISTIEHIGLSCGISDSVGDIKAMREISRMLNEGGSAIVTVPYGTKSAVVNQMHRVYDRTALSKLLRSFSVAKKEFYRFSSGKWQRSSEAAAFKAIDEYIPPNFHNAACVCLLLKKRHHASSISQETLKVRRKHR